MDDEDQAMKNERGTAETARQRRRRAAETNENGQGGEVVQEQQAAGKRPKERRLIVGPQSSFDFEGRKLRSICEGAAGWFIGPDACSLLAVGNVSAAIARLDDDEVGITVIDTATGRRRVLVVSESGLYRLILTSEKPEANAFRRWVTGEVLPSIRRTGTYQTEDRAGGFVIPIPDAHLGVYVATILQDLSTRVRRADFPALFAEIDAFDAQIMASALTTIASYWHKAELLRSMDIDLDDGVALAGLESSIREGNKVARHFLFHFLRRAAEADAELSNRPTPGDKTH